jgi:hypothetical protein
LDGVAKDLEIEKQFLEIDEGKTQHVHGLLSHAHILKQDADHGKKFMQFIKRHPLVLAHHAGME